MKHLFVLKETNEKPMYDDFGLPGHESSTKQAIQACQHLCSARPSREAHDTQPNFPSTRNSRFENRNRSGKLCDRRYLAIPCHPRTVTRLSKYAESGDYSL